MANAKLVLDFTLRILHFNGIYFGLYHLLVSKPI
jgi:hypothetical protein